MNFIRLAFWVFICIGMLSCANNLTSNKNNPAKADKDEVLYQQKNGKNITVFNLTERYFSFEGQGYLKRRDFQYGEFGGNYKNCSNADYFCMRVGLNLAIPKIITEQKTWQFSGIDCQLESAVLHQQPMAIKCAFDDYSIRFSYSLEKGIISYVQSTKPFIEFELIGDKGLFANDEVSQ